MEPVIFCAAAKVCCNRALARPLPRGRIMKEASLQSHAAAGDRPFARSKHIQGRCRCKCMKRRADRSFDGYTSRLRRRRPTIPSGSHAAPEPRYTQTSCGYDTAVCASCAGAVTSALWSFCCSHFKTTIADRIRNHSCNNAHGTTQHRAAPDPDGARNFMASITFPCAIWAGEVSRCVAARGFDVSSNE